jgi:hypothetical protein
MVTVGVGEGALGGGPGGGAYVDRCGGGPVGGAYVDCVTSGVGAGEGVLRDGADLTGDAYVVADSV